MKNANPLSRWVLAGLLLSAVDFAGCGAKPQAAPEAPKTVYDHFPIRLGSKVASLQVAVLEPEMERGLMQRPDLAHDEGMIFVYGSPQRMNFWMHNTPEALDIGFFTPEGVLAEIYPLLPFDEKTVSSRSERMQFAIEMNQGWYAANGVRPGDKLDMSALGEAMAARGFDPKKLVPR